MTQNYVAIITYISGKETRSRNITRTEIEEYMKSTDVIRKDTVFQYIASLSRTITHIFYSPSLLD